MSTIRDLSTAMLNSLKVGHPNAILMLPSTWLRQRKINKNCLELEKHHLE